MESLSNYSENETCQRIMRKIYANTYESEELFVRDLDEQEMDYLDKVLEVELDYAKSAGDDVRLHELTEVFELLF